MQPKRRPTVFDLEKATGVSRGTISRAFNNGAEINAETREMVLRTAARIGYTPHPGARTMKSGRTHRWGLLIPHLQNPWYAELTEAFDREAQRNKSMLVLGMTHYHADRERSFVQHWAAGDTDGIIVTSSGSDSNYSLYAELQARGFPVVFLYASPRRKFDYVSCDESPNCREALERLYELGHRRIAFAGHQHQHARLTPPFIAYQSFLEAHGIPLKEELIHFGESDFLAGGEAWQKWKTLPEFPTAVACDADVTACSIIQHARDDGMQVPRDLSVVGLTDVAEAARAGLTSIRIDSGAFAKAVFELLLRPRGEGMPAKTSKMVPSELVMRHSFGPPRQVSAGGRRKQQTAI